MSKGAYWILMGSRCRTLQLKLGRPILRVLPCLVYCIRIADKDPKGFYDTQYSDRTRPDCRGRLRSDEEGRYGYRAVVPVAYAIPGDVRRSHPDPSLR